MGQTCLSSFHAVGSPSAAPAGAQSRQTPGSSRPHRLLTPEKGVLSLTDCHVWQVAMSERYLAMRSKVRLSNDLSAFLCLCGDYMCWTENTHLLVRVDACVCMYMYTCMCGTESAHWCECMCVHVHVPFGQKMSFVCMYL